MAAVMRRRSFRWQPKPIICIQGLSYIHFELMNNIKQTMKSIHMDKTITALFEVLLSNGYLRVC